MRISQTIVELQKILEHHGDIQINVYSRAEVSHVPAKPKYCPSMDDVVFEPE